MLLRGEMTASDLRGIIRSARSRLDVPVSYADVIEFWLRHRDVGDDVDFVTVHVLPYWEDMPVRAEDAALHVDDIRKEMAAAFPGIAKGRHTTELPGPSTPHRHRARKDSSRRPSARVPPTRAPRPRGTACPPTQRKAYRVSRFGIFIP